MSAELEKLQWEQPNIDKFSLDEYPNIAKHFLFLQEQLEKFGARNPEIIEKVWPHIENAQKLAQKAIQTLEESKWERWKLEAEIEIWNRLFTHVDTYSSIVAQLDKLPAQNALA